MAKVNQKPPPVELRMPLFAPGMSILHRAGLGGLACTLRVIERAWEGCLLASGDVPGDPSLEGPLPWKVTSDEVVLSFGQPEAAREYLRRLFALAFGLRDGLIWLPGQYGDMPPSLAVRAEVQAGLTLTFLQHGKTRKLVKELLTHEVDPTGDGTSLVSVTYRPCSWYKHQDGWDDLTDNKTGSLRTDPVEVIGPLNPGAVVRHVAFTAATKIEEAADRALPLYFALVGCLALPASRGGGGVLVVPDVDDLEVFSRDRPLLTPASVRECRVGGAGDAALQAEVRLRARGVVNQHGLPACHAAQFLSLPWASQQKSRGLTLFYDAAEAGRVEPEHRGRQEKALALFEVAMAALPPRIVTPRAGAGPAPGVTGASPSFLADSRVRPLVADNLARGENWYHGFLTLMTPKKASDQLSFERKGLREMTDAMNDQEFANEKALIRAIHEAIRRKRRRIKEDTQGEARGASTQATRNRQDRFMERFRLSLVGAKTADQCRGAIVGLLGQVLYNPEVQAGVDRLLPLLHDKDRWQEARDLALLALASYGSPWAAPAQTATKPTASE